MDTEGQQLWAGVLDRSASQRCPAKNSKNQGAAEGFSLGPG